MNDQCHGCEPYIRFILLKSRQLHPHLLTSQSTPSDQTFQLRYVFIVSVSMQAGSPVYRFCESESAERHAVVDPSRLSR